MLRCIVTYNEVLTALAYDRILFHVFDCPAYTAARQPSNVWQLTVARLTTPCSSRWHERWICLLYIAVDDNVVGVTRYINHSSMFSRTFSQNFRTDMLNNFLADFFSKVKKNRDVNRLLSTSHIQGCINIDIAFDIGIRWHFVYWRDGPSRRSIKSQPQIP